MIRGNLLRGKPLRILVPLTIAVCLPVTGLLWYLQKSDAGPSPSRLVVGPARLDQLGGWTWRQVVDKQGDKRHVEAWEGESPLRPGHADYFEEVSQYSTDAVAKWHYRSSVRINFEEDFPGQVVDTRLTNTVLADEFDVYCVDVEGTLKSDPNSCATWVYWARYSRYLIYLRFDDSQLTATEFGQVVSQLDRETSIALKRPSPSP